VTIVSLRLYAMNDVAQFALEVLRDNSPTSSSPQDHHARLYRDSHLIFLNGRNVPDATSWRPGFELTISNPTPYARKIEVGSMHVDVSAHVYERSVPAINREHGDVMTCSFAWLPLNFAQVAGWLSGPGAALGGSKSRVLKNEWLSRQPTLVFTAIPFLRGGASIYAG
jgi:hypothetical protein